MFNLQWTRKILILAIVFFSCTNFNGPFSPKSWKCWFTLLPYITCLFNRVRLLANLEDQVRKLKCIYLAQGYTKCFTARKYASKQ